MSAESTKDIFHCSQSPVKHRFSNNSSDGLLCQLKNEIKAEGHFYGAHSKDYSCFGQTALKSPVKELIASLVLNKSNSGQNLNTITTSLSLQSAESNGCVKEECTEAEIDVQQVMANNDYFSEEKESCFTETTLPSTNITSDHDEDDDDLTVSGSTNKEKNKKKCTKARLGLHKNIEGKCVIKTRKKPAITQDQMCTLCGKSFTRPDHLKIHMRIHTGEKPYKCTECDKCFVRCGELSVHMRFHKGVKPYVCTKCGKHFSVSTHLKEHEYSHTGIKPHACSHCDKSFAHAGDLVKHRRIHTDERPYPCLKCGMAFRRIQTLKKHEKRHTRSKSGLRDISDDT